MRRVPRYPTPARRETPVGHSARMRRPHDPSPGHGTFRPPGDSLSKHYGAQGQAGAVFVTNSCPAPVELRCATLRWQTCRPVADKHCHQWPPLYWRKPRSRIFSLGTGNGIPAKHAMAWWDMHRVAGSSLTGVYQTLPMASHPNQRSTECSAPRVLTLILASAPETSGPTKERS